MFTIDIPDLTNTSVNTVFVAVPSNKPTTNSETIHSMGICMPVNKFREPDQIGEYTESGLSPEDLYLQYFALYGEKIAQRSIVATVTLLTPAQHGKIVELPQDDGTIYRVYVPNAGYLGNDNVVFLVTYQGKSVKLIYNLKVTNLLVGATGTDELFCPEGAYWKISSLDSSNPTTITYSNLLQGALGDFKGFADLPAGEVGNTTGSGANAAITLDVSANGYGWYQTANPFDNSDFLPTADANIWIAKAGAIAERAGVRGITTPSKIYPASPSVD